MKTPKKTILKMTIAGLSLAALHSSPTLADNKDNRRNTIRDMEIFKSSAPILGGGYDYSTKTFKSTCFTHESDPKRNVTAKLDYRFEEVNQSNMTEWSTTSSVESKFKYWFVSGSNAFKSKSSDTNKSSYKQVLITYTVDAMYDVLDDSKVEFLPAAANLIRTKNLSAFMLGCGDHYVRQLDRTKVYYGLLTYQSTDDISDRKFEENLQLSLSGFFSSMDLDVAITSSFHQEVANRRLTIQIQAQGLSLADMTEGLLPMSIDDFYKTAKSTINAMRNPDTGLITAAHVVPWASHPAFLEAVQNAIDPQNTNPDSSLDAASDIGTYLVNSAARARATEALQQVSYLQSDYRECLDDFLIDKISQERATSNDGSDTPPNASLVYQHRNNANSIIFQDQLEDLLNKPQYLTLVSSAKNLRNSAKACLKAFVHVEDLWKIDEPEACVNLEFPEDLNLYYTTTKSYCPLTKAEGIQKI